MRTCSVCVAADGGEGKRCMMAMMMMMVVVMMVVIELAIVACIFYP